MKVPRLVFVWLVLLAWGKKWRRAGPFFRDSSLSAAVLRIYLESGRPVQRTGFELMGGFLVVSQFHFVSACASDGAHGGLTPSERA